MEKLLARSAALNPFSAATLAGKGLDIQQLVSLSEAEAANYVQQMSGSSTKSALLFQHQIRGAYTLMTGDEILWIGYYI